LDREKKQFENLGQIGLSQFNNEEKQIVGQKSLLSWLNPAAD